MIRPDFLSRLIQLSRQFHDDDFHAFDISNDWICLFVDGARRLPNFRFLISKKEAAHPLTSVIAKKHIGIPTLNTVILLNSFPDQNIRVMV